MNLNSKHIRWCWQNNYYADVVPVGIGMQPDVRIELSNRIDAKDNYGKPCFGKRTIQVGKEVFSQKSLKERFKIYEEVNRVYELIYNKYK